MLYMWLFVFLPLSKAFCYNCSSDTISPCRCDSDCVLFNDCCPLANATADSEPTLNNKQCQPVVVSGIVTSVNQAYYMISTCQDVSGEIARKCDDSDLAAPVTDSSTGLTYRNLYCALCHNVSIGELAMWLVNFQCNHNLTLDNSLKVGDFQRHCLLHSFEPQPQIVQHTRWCLPSISHCSINSTSLDFQDNCAKGQLNPVIADGKVYRNLYLCQM